MSYAKKNRELHCRRRRRGELTRGMPLVSGVKRMMKRDMRKTQPAKKRKMPHCETHNTLSLT